MSIRLTITGASGVGKTTLAECIAELLELPLIPELARELCSEMGYPRIGDIPDQEKFKRDALERQIDTELKHESFVADRSAIDTWVLWQRWNICTAMTYDTEAIYELVSKHISHYTHIIYIPPMFKAEEDGFRWTEPDYIKQVDRIIRMTLYELDLWEKVMVITKDNITERILEVQRWIERQSVT